MSDEIKVHVVKYPDRENLVMRYRDPFNGKQVQLSIGVLNPASDRRFKTGQRWNRSSSEWL